jgi:hypothetical protein
LHGLLPPYKAERFEPLRDSILKLINVDHSEQCLFSPSFEKLRDVWNDLVSDLTRQYNWDRKQACDISPFKTPNGTTVYESKSNYRLPDDYDLLERSASMRFAVNETAEGVREALAN